MTDIKLAKGNRGSSTVHKTTSYLLQVAKIETRVRNQRFGMEQHMDFYGLPSINTGEQSAPLPVIEFSKSVTRMHQTTGFSTGTENIKNNHKELEYFNIQSWMSIKKNVIKMRRAKENSTAWTNIYWPYSQSQAASICCVAYQESSNWFRGEYFLHLVSRNGSHKPSRSIPDVGRGNVYRWWTPVSDHLWSFHTWDGLHFRTCTARCSGTRKTVKLSIFVRSIQRFAWRWSTGTIKNSIVLNPLIFQIAPNLLESPPKFTTFKHHADLFFGQETMFDTLNPPLLRVLYNLTFQFAEAFSQFRTMTN